MGMAYFGKKLPGMVAAAPGEGNNKSETAPLALSHKEIGAALMKVVEQKMFPGIANVWDGITSREQLEELVDKVGVAFDRVEEMKKQDGGGVVHNEEEDAEEAEEAQNAENMVVHQIMETVEQKKKEE